MKIIARNTRWVPGCVITESIDPDDTSTPRRSRFTATINGWRNFRIYEGQLFEGCVEAVCACVHSIRDRMEAGDDSVFEHKGYWLPIQQST